jgi:PAP2 superfamily
VAASLVRSAWRSDLLRQAAIILTGFWLYKTGRHLIQPDWPRAMANAHRIFKLEQAFHFAWEGHLQRMFMALPELVRAMNVFYLTGHFMLTGIFFVWLYFRTRDGFHSFRNGFLIATAVSLFIHWKFPTAPPRVANVGLTDTLWQLSHVDIGNPTTGSAFTNPVAAVPSLHAGWALAVGIGLILYGRGWLPRVVGVVYPVAVTVTIIVTGNHFIFDAVAGDAVMGLGFLVAWQLWPNRKSGRTGAILAPATRGGAVR